MDARQEIAKILCHRSRYPIECGFCRQTSGCPDRIPAIAAKTDAILALEWKEGGKHYRVAVVEEPQEDIIDCPTVFKINEYGFFLGVYYLLNQGYRKVVKGE